MFQYTGDCLNTACNSIAYDSKTHEPLHWVGSVFTLKGKPAEISKQLQLMNTQFDGATMEEVTNLYWELTHDGTFEENDTHGITNWMLGWGG